MMKKLILLSIIILSVVKISGQILELTPGAPGNSKLIKTNVTNVVTSTFLWSKTDPLSVIGVVTGSGGTGTADSAIVTANPAAIDGQSATITVQAQSTSASCLSSSQTLTINIKNPANVTLKAAFGTAPASICQGSTAPFALTFTGGTVTSYKYFIDLNSNGILDGSEVEVSQVPATGTSDNLSVVINATGTVPVVISWVTGTVGAVSVTSAQTAVSQSVTVDKKPVIQLIY